MKRYSCHWCGKRPPSEYNLIVYFEDKKYDFCSTDCVRKWLSKVDHYLKNIDKVQLSAPSSPKEEN